MATSRPFRVVAVLLLLVAAFGGLSVGVPLVIAVLTTAPTADGASPAVVPAAFLAYGLVSLAGAIGMLAGWRRTTALVVTTQAIVALGLLWVWVAVVADASLLIVAGIAAGAGLCAAADRLLAGSG